MKNIIPYLTFGLLFLGMFLFTNGVLADAPPDPGGDPGGTGTPVGGGSPVGSGLVIMLSLAASYGGLKMFQKRK